MSSELPMNCWTCLCRGRPRKGLAPHEGCRAATLDKRADVQMWIDKNVRDPGIEGPCFDGFVWPAATADGCPGYEARQPKES